MQGAEWSNSTGCHNIDQSKPKLRDASLYVRTFLKVILSVLFFFLFCIVFETEAVPWLFLQLIAMGVMPQLMDREQRWEAGAGLQAFLLLRDLDFHLPFGVILSHKASSGLKGRCSSFIWGHSTWQRRLTNSYLHNQLIHTKAHFRPVPSFGLGDIWVQYPDLVSVWYEYIPRDCTASVISALLL